METASIVSIVVAIIKLAWELYCQFKAAPKDQKQEVLTNVQKLHAATKAGDLTTINSLFNDLLASKGKANG
jgi:hypothetical protein